MLLMRHIMHPCFIFKPTFYTKSVLVVSLHTPSFWVLTTIYGTSISCDMNQAAHFDIKFTDEKEEIRENKIDDRNMTDISTCRRCWLIKVVHRCDNTQMHKTILRDMYNIHNQTYLWVSRLKSMSFEVDCASDRTCKDANILKVS